MGNTMLPIAMLKWHYTRAIHDYFHIWKNFLDLVRHIFSFSDLLKTLFSPWRRLEEPLRRGNGIDFEQFFGGILVNFMMRLIGFLVRSVFLVLGLVCFALIVVVGLLVFAFWVLLPGVVLGSVLSGIIFLVS